MTEKCVDASGLVEREQSVVAVVASVWGSGFRA
jgi:hypothetical protein